MIILPDLLTIIAILTTIGILIAVAAFIHKILKGERDFQEKEAETFTRNDKILKKAHDQARAMMYTTSIAAEEMLSDSKQTNENISEDLDKILQNIAAKHIHDMKTATEAFEKSYTQYLIDMQGKFQEQEQQTMTMTQDTVHKSLEAFSASLSSKTIGIQETIDKRTTEMLDQVELELADYKAGRLRKIDTEISQLIQKTFQEVLQKSIPESIHEELIMDALEKAKKESVLVV
jgi:MFS superfamily sulfate permease-like transporter